MLAHLAASRPISSWKEKPEPYLLCCMNLHPDFKLSEDDVKEYDVNINSVSWRKTQRIWKVPWSVKALVCQKGKWESIGQFVNLWSDQYPALPPKLKDEIFSMQGEEKVLNSSTFSLPTQTSPTNLQWSAYWERDYSPGNWACLLTTKHPWFNWQYQGITSILDGESCVYTELRTAGLQMLSLY